MKEPKVVKRMDQISAEIDRLQRAIKGDEAIKMLVEETSRRATATESRLRANLQKMRELQKEYNELEAR